MRCQARQFFSNILIILCTYFLSQDAFAFSLQGDLGKVVQLFIVDEIRIVGVKKVEPEAILEKITIKKGASLDNYTLKRDIEKIYEMKFFENIEAHQIVEGKKNILEFKIKEKPIISKIEYTGNDELDGDDFKDHIKTKPFNILDINTLKNDTLAIQKVYEEKGFYLAQVAYELKYNGEESVDVIYKIKEYDKVKVKKVMFLGNFSIGDDELKGFMQTKEESLFSWMSGSGSYKEFNFQSDIERIKYLYKTRGYLQVNVGSPSITVSEDKKWIFITVGVVEGPKFSVNNIYFNGELLFTDSELREKVTLKPDETYSEEKLRNDIQTLTEMYQDKGYAFANVLRTLEIVPGENKVDINFSFEKGKIAYFGDIIVKGNSKTRDKVIRRELRIYEGMKYSGSLLRISKDNVNRLGFFEQGSVIFNTVSPKGKDDVLNVEISVKERQTGQISVGAGYSTATKGFFQATVQQNNFRGLGQNLNFSLSLANGQQIYNVGFTEPYFMDTLWTAGADYFKTVSSFIRSYTMEKHGFDLRVGYPVYEYARLFVTYKFETTTIDNVLSPFVVKEQEEGVSSGLELSIRYDRRNNAFEPTNGEFGRASLEYIGIGGDMKWTKAELEGRMYRPIIGDLVFRSRVRAGQLYPVDGEPIPRHALYAMGGARDMRGYGLQGIGPTRRGKNLVTQTEQDFNIGGQFSLLGTVELEHPLIREAGLKWVVFYDAGNVFENYMGKDDSDLRANYGFGFRWFSPIGVLRFEFGYPVNPKDTDAGNQFNFDIGPFF
jgi:outer membrane protein insertion porin family